MVAPMIEVRVAKGARIVFRKDFPKDIVRLPEFVQQALSDFTQNFPNVSLLDPDVFLKIAEIIP